MTISTEAQARSWLATLPQWTAKAEARLLRFCELLAAENARQNLVSEQSLLAVWQRHIADSAQLLSFVPRETTGPWLDLGTGAGFPGLAVAVLLPDISVHLVESRARRIEWLLSAAQDLGLANVTVHGARLEHVESFSVRTISARAFAPLPRLLELSARFSTADTVWLLPKGRSAAQELAELSGWDHMFHVEQSITDPEAGVIVGTLLSPTKHRKKGKTP